VRSSRGKKKEKRKRKKKTMKLNIASPRTGCQKTLDIDDEKRCRIFYDKRLGQEVEADGLGDQFRGYVFKITGGCDKQGFPMMQGVLEKRRVRLLLNKDSGCYHPHRKGQRRRKSVRGCIVSPEMSVLNLIIVKQGDEELDGITNDYKPRRLGPKRANNIRKLFDLSKEDDVRKYVVRRVIEKEGHYITKSTNIQRLITPARLQRKRHRAAIKRRRYTHAQEEAAAYAKLLAQRHRAKRSEIVSKRRLRSSIRSTAKSTTE
jgi:small subunit ribosomal protein S6e